MKRQLRNIMLLISPFIIMIVINEMVRPTIKEKPYLNLGITAMNSSRKTTNKCTWICHNNTEYCIQHHIKFNHQFLKITDPIYFGVIGLLKSTGVYALANIVFLVILIP